MDERWKTTFWISLVLLTLSGCAGTTFHASELPGRYAARPIRDYSELKLAQYARPAPDADTILPGDRLQVRLDPGTLEEESQLTWPVSVDSSGETSLPNIGASKLAGLTNTEAEKAIKQASLDRDVFLTPTVEVAVQDRRERIIYVSGAVTQPGPIKVLADEISLADVIVRAGGLTRDASGAIAVSAIKRKIQLPPGVDNAIQPVSTGSVQAMTISLESPQPQEFGEMMVPVGAVVSVEQTAPRPIKVSGVIDSKAIEVPAGQNVRLLDALSLAGGQTYSNWISDRITVIRTDPATNKTIRIKASLRAARKDSAENILLAPHDEVHVEENLFTFTLSTISGFLGAGFNASRLAL